MSALHCCTSRQQNIAELGAAAVTIQSARANIMEILGIRYVNFVLRHEQCRLGFRYCDAQFIIAGIPIASSTAAAVLTMG